MNDHHRNVFLSDSQEMNMIGRLVPASVISVSLVQQRKRQR